MRSYWDESARRNAVWYVDTSLDYDEPDLERFFETGRVIVSQALEDAPATPSGNGLAVEIGCGLGRICQALADRFDKVVGVDISPEMLKRAREVVQKPNVEFVQGDGLTLDVLESASADLVLSFTVFQHIPSIDVICRYLTEAGRVLKPGGVFVFQWNNESGSLRWQLRRGVLSTLQRTGLRRERHDRHAAEFLGSRVPLSRIEPALEAGGLRLKEVRGGGTLFAWAWAQRDH